MVNAGFLSPTQLEWRKAKAEVIARRYGPDVAWEVFDSQHPLALWLIQRSEMFGQKVPDFILVHTGQVGVLAQLGLACGIEVESGVLPLLSVVEMEAVLAHELDHIMRVDPFTPYHPDDRFSRLTEVGMKALASCMVKLSPAKKVIFGRDENLADWRRLLATRWYEGVNERRYFEHLADAAAAMAVGKQPLVSALQKIVAAKKQRAPFLLRIIGPHIRVHPTLAERITAIENETYFAEAAQLYKKPFYPKTLANG